MNNLFSKYLDLYDQLYYGNQDLYKKEIKDIIKFFPNHVKNVLDVGCGTGKHALELFKLGYNVDCLDISPLAVKKTRKNLHTYKPNIFLGDIAKIKLTKKYDAIISLFMVLSYLSVKKFVQALHIIYNSLNKNGIFIFDVVNGQQILNNFEPKIKVSSKGIKAIWTRQVIPQKQLLQTSALIIKENNVYKEKENFTYYLPKDLKQILEMAGFRRIKIFTDYKGRKDYNKKKTKLCVICYK